MADTTAALVGVTRQMPSTTIAPVPILPDIVLTVLFISGCAMVGIIISKVADFVYDKHVSRTNKNHLRSDNTKKLLKARVAVMRMKPDPRTKDGRLAKRAASVWMAKASGKTEPQIMVDINHDTQQIGQTHVPGIEVQRPATEHSTEESHQSTSNRSHSPHSTVKVEEHHAKANNAESQKELHPVEKINIKIKPGGPLPPVSVHDLSKV